MNSRVTDIYLTYRRRPTSDLITLARNACDNLVRSLEKYYTYDTAINVVAVLLNKFIAADGKIAENEYYLITNMFGNLFTYDKFCSSVKNLKDKYSDADVKGCISRDNMTKQYCAELGFALCAIDGQISMKEEDLLDYLTD